MTKLVTAIIGHIIAGAMVAFAAMLALGVGHHDIHPAVPVLGYLPCLVVVLAVSSTIRFLSYSFKGKP